MSEMVFVSDLTQGERRLVLPEGKRVVVAGDALHPDRYEHATILQPVLSKNRVVAYQVEYKDGSTAWVDVKSLRVEKDTIPQDVLPFIESLAHPAKEIEEAAREDDSYFGLLLKESRGDEITEGDIAAYQEKMKKFERDLAREDRMRWREEQGLEARRRDYGWALVIGEQARQVENQLAKLRATQRQRPLQPQELSLFEKAIKDLEDIETRKERRAFAIRKAQETLPTKYKPMASTAEALKLTDEELGKGKKTFVRDPDDLDDEGLFPLWGMYDKLGEKLEKLDTPDEALLNTIHAKIMASYPTKPLRSANIFGLFDNFGDLTNAYYDVYSEEQKGKPRLPTRSFGWRKYLIWGGLALVGVGAVAWIAKRNKRR